MKRKILITGGNGFIGSHLVKKLLLDEHDLYLIIRQNSDLRRINHLIDQVHLIENNKNNLSLFFEKVKPDYIFHLATYYEKKDSGESIEKMIDTNIKLPATLIDLGQKNGLMGFINLGTYFEITPESTYSNNETVYDPFNMYATTKILLDTLLDFNYKQLNKVTLRLFTPYGPHDNEKLIIKLLRSTLRNSTILKLSYGFQKINLVYISDVIDALVQTLNYLECTQTPKRFFHIGGKEVLSIRELVNIIEDVIGSKCNIQWGTSSPEERDVFNISYKLEREHLKWFPKVGIDEGIFKTYQSIINEKV